MNSHLRTSSIHQSVASRQSLCDARSKAVRWDVLPRVLSDTYSVGPGGRRPLVHPPYRATTRLHSLKTLLYACPNIYSHDRHPKALPFLGGYFRVGSLVRV